MRKWRMWMAVMCVAAMAGTMAMPVYAQEDTAEEEYAEEETGEDAGEEDPAIAEISETMRGLWEDNAGDIYGFYSDSSFLGQWKSQDMDVTGTYSLATNGDLTALSLVLDEDNDATFFVVPNTEENILELYENADDTEPTASLKPYESTDENEKDYNKVYQTMAEKLDYCFKGVTDAGETFLIAENQAGDFCTVMCINSDDQYVSFVGKETHVDESTFTVEDEVSQMSLTFGAEANDDGTLTIDMGDTGSATVEQALVADAIQLLKYCVENGTPMN